MHCCPSDHRASVALEECKRKATSGIDASALFSIGLSRARDHNLRKFALLNAIFVDRDLDLAYLPDKIWVKKPPFGSTTDSDSSLCQLWFRSFSKMLRAPVPAFNRDSGGIGKVCLWRRSLFEVVPERVGVREVAGCVHVGTGPAKRHCRKVYGSGGGTIPGWQDPFVRFQLTDLVIVTSCLGRGGHNQNKVFGCSQSTELTKIALQPSR